MKRSNRSWLVLLVAIAMIGVGGCSDDDLLDIPIEEAVEAGLDSALQETAEPLVSFMGAFGVLVSSPAPFASRGGFSCPDTTGWCSSGSVACLPTTGLEFDFDECVVVAGDEPLTLDGVVVAIPGSPTTTLTLNSVFINNTPAVSGTGSINVAACDYFVNVTSTDGVVVSGLVTICNTDPYPTGDQLLISFDDFSANVTFDGTNIADVFVSQGATPVATCTIDLASDPLSSSCDAI